MGAQAQSISGSVTGPDEKPLEKASVTLLNAKDSSVQMLTAADKTGKYRFNQLNVGTYLVMASNVGYTKSYSAPVVVNDKEATVNAIILEKANTQLTGVVVTSKKPPFEVKAGKTVVNVDASPTNAGLNVLEILEKSPGISVDADGNVSLKGKSGVLILIDGKQTYLNGTQLAAFLKSIQASGLDQIEIMTNPPAKYDAAGGAGVINIKTKKGVVKGMNGNVNLNYAQGFYPKYNGGANFNYRNNKINVFGTYNGGVWEGLGTLTIHRNFYKDGTFSGSSDQTTDRHNKSQWHNGKLGFDYNFTDKDVAGVVVTGNINPWKNWQQSASNLRDVDGAINTTLISDAFNSNKSRNINTNLNYKHSFDSAGREFSVDLDQGYYENRGSNALTTNVYNPDNSKRGNTVLLNGDFPSVIHIYSGKMDYVHPFNKNLKLETGIKSSFVNTDNNVLYRRDTSTGWYQDKQRTNHFIYKENINAAYAIVTATIKKWEFTGGLRVENTNAKGTQVTIDSSFKRNYTNLFPNVGAVYSFNDKNQLSVAYSRRIRRPDYDDLNPFVFFLDSLTYGQGNPYLQPEFSNRVEVSHTFNRFLTFTVSHTQTNNIITQLIKQNTEKKTAFQTTENFSKRKQWGFSVSANKQLFKWWNLSLYSGVFNNQYKGLYTDGTKNVPVTLNVNNVDANMTNSFTFAKTWTAELGGWYSSSPSEGLLIAHSMGAMNIALAKQLFNKNGSLKIGVRDLLRTSNFSGYSRYADVDLSVANDRRRDNRQYNISFTYKFGKGNIKPARRRTGGADDEQNRVKSGGG
ncbi:TonB-dependent receptor [Niabella sp. CC-SYL272]|uniref:TonB-dependent receptor domain-containing protein n=1 Tax=Niabella agricola TaxID=2891571 RepID=UPI001F1760DF|nr:TonB-dependent receptor [Niabella agricola]MCF3110123.1 TonB-dependent receptor [Niabella agricola]